MVTQSARIAMARQAMADFAAQTHAPRELVVLHDGDDDCDAALREAASAHAGAAAIRVEREAAGHSLGWLRNAAVGRAQGSHVCQWDDDDRYHPQRLALQWRALGDAQAEFCFLGDQLHWFARARQMFWEDWDRDAYPINVVQGSLLGRRERMPAYPDSARGEDTGLLLEILRRGDPIARLRGVGWCYVYVGHGANAWPDEHHAAIARRLRLGLAALLQREAELRQRLGEYQPGFGSLVFPHEAGVLRLAPATT